MSPILSVVIPTYKRPAMLDRAILSALNAAPDKGAEVIVVPNGNDTSWKIVAHKYRAESRVDWRPLDAPNACSARNFGLAHARGKYIRFLDDDDFLYPTAAEQLVQIEGTNADLCSAPLQCVHSDGQPGQIFRLPVTNDFPEAALLAGGISLTEGTIFRNAAIKDCKWPEDVVLYDDYIWMVSLATNREFDWIQTATPVGAYVQHDAARLSRVRRAAQNSRPLVASILNLHRRLHETNRSTPKREHAAATALLTHAHSAFPSCPRFLSRTIKQAREIAPNAHPSQSLFANRPWLANHLLLTEWLMVVPRLLTRGYRRATWHLNGVRSQKQAEST